MTIDASGLSSRKARPSYLAMRTAFSLATEPPLFATRPSRAPARVRGTSMVSPEMSVALTSHSVLASSTRYIRTLAFVRLPTATVRASM